jgi:hypothetical protein
MLWKCILVQQGSLSNPSYNLILFIHPAIALAPSIGTFAPFIIHQPSRNMHHAVPHLFRYTHKLAVRRPFKNVNEKDVPTIMLIEGRNAKHGWDLLMHGTNWVTNPSTRKN